MGWVRTTSRYSCATNGVRGHDATISVQGSFAEHESHGANRVDQFHRPIRKVDEQLDFTCGQLHRGACDGDPSRKEINGEIADAERGPLVDTSPHQGTNSRQELGEGNGFTR